LCDEPVSPLGNDVDAGFLHRASEEKRSLMQDGDELERLFPGGAFNKKPLRGRIGKSEAKAGFPRIHDREIRGFDDFQRIGSCPHDSREGRIPGEVDSGLDGKQGRHVEAHPLPVSTFDLPFRHDRASVWTDLFLDDRGGTGKVQEAGDELTCLAGHGVFGHHACHDEVVLPGAKTVGNKGCDREGADVSLVMIEDVNPMIRAHSQGPFQGGAHSLGADGERIDEAPGESFFYENGFFQGELVEAVHPESAFGRQRKQTGPLIDLERFETIRDLLDANEDIH
jgi:hypothetical protein